MGYVTTIAADMRHWGHHSPPCWLESRDLNMIMMAPQITCHSRLINDIWERSGGRQPVGFFVIVGVTYVILICQWKLANHKIANLSIISQTFMKIAIQFVGKCYYSTTWHTWTRWRHQTETLSALLVLCAGNSPVTGEFPSQRPVTRSFDVFFDLCLNKRLSKL